MINTEKRSIQLPNADIGRLFCDARDMHVENSRAKGRLCNDRPIRRDNKRRGAVCRAKKKASGFRGAYLRLGARLRGKERRAMRERKRNGVYKNLCAVTRKRSMSAPDKISEQNSPPKFPFFVRATKGDMPRAYSRFSINASAHAP